MDSEESVQSYKPNYDNLIKLNHWLGIVITAEGVRSDFVSRYFCPELRAEDAVTGSSHCSLAPIWNRKLGKSCFTARQLSPRGGILYCNMTENSVEIAGEAAVYYRGELYL